MCGGVVEKALLTFPRIHSGREVAIGRDEETFRNATVWEVIQWCGFLMGALA